MDKDSAHIIVADGATSTLYNANIASSNNWSGITCSSDATIILKGSNKVSSNYAGIQSGGPSTTLTIKGSGSLTAESQSSIGIGSGSDSSCGPITITTGVTSVTATAGGGSWDTTKHSKHSIGAGDGGSCWTISIGGTVYWDLQDGSTTAYKYKNGGDTYLTQSLFTYTPSN